MCGIAGIVQFNSAPVDKNLIEAMCAIQAHRGPDGEGILCRNSIGLGHRRLAIIDPQGGRQPMVNEDESVAIVCNGEIYNFRELRDELERKGHHFKTRCDSEVIVHGWEEWGAKCVERFRGMFALVVADWRRRKIFIARDHLGIKPLYYYRTAKEFAFASELQSLRTLPECSTELDLTAVDNFLTLLYIPSPRTIYKGVNKLPPASRMTIDFDGHTVGPESYWKLAFKPDYSLGYDEWAKRLEHILRDSVRAHLVADVPFGAFLSGGIDSTAVVGMMTEELQRPVATFSIGFEEEGFSELSYARQVANYWKTDHYEEIVRPDASCILPEMVRHYGEPFGDSSALPTYYVSRLARQHVPMVLTGDGGDEALLGYGRYVGWRKWVNPGLPKRSSWKRLVRPALAKALPGRFPQDCQTRTPCLKDWLDFSGSMSNALRADLWLIEHLGGISRTLEEFESIANDADEVVKEQYGQYIDYRSYLPNDILAKVDIASMAHGLEVRTPLVDVTMAEFVSSIPWEMNLRDGGNGVWSGKKLLKKILSPHFGEEFLERKKAGFVVPLARWLGEGGILRAEILDRFLCGNAKIYDYFSEEKVKQLITDQGHKEQDQPQVLWQLLFFENWLEHVGSAREEKKNLGRS